MFGDDSPIVRVLDATIRDALLEQQSQAQRVLEDEWIRSLELTEPDFDAPVPKMQKRLSKGAQHRPERKPPQRWKGRGKDDHPPRRMKMSKDERQETMSGRAWAVKKQSREQGEKRSGKKGLRKSPRGYFLRMRGSLRRLRRAWNCRGAVGERQRRNIARNARQNRELPSS